jgi:predicted flap endonuclease-1-like 5' DNA nuclease
MAEMENDLHKLSGIGPKHTEMLEKIGVDSIKELSHRTASSLKAMIEERHGSVVGLSEAQVQGWIDQAKAAQA